MLRLVAIAALCVVALAASVDWDQELSSLQQSNEELTNFNRALDKRINALEEKMSNSTR
jgi:hypothetical protein